MVITQSLLQRTPLPVAVLDRELRLIICSDYWFEQYDPQRHFHGRLFNECLPDLPEEIMIDINYCLEGVEHRTETVRFLDANGNLVWYEWKINSWLNESEEVGGLIVILENRTEKKRNEDLLEKAQEVARIGGWEVNLLENTIYWSRMTREIHEVPEDFVPDLESGINFYKEGASRETISRCVQAAMQEGKPWDEELQIVTVSGREVWVRAKGEAEILDGKCVQLTGTFQDIDQRKRAELKYKRASERLALVTDAARMGIWEFDPVSDELFWDANMYSVYGVQASQFKGVYEAWESCVHPEDKERSAREVEEAISGERDFDTLFRIIWPDGQIRWIKAFAIVIRDKNGTAKKMIGVNEDITELRNTQLQLRMSEESLQGAFENSRVGMSLVGLDGRFIKVNESLCNSLGYTSEELLELTFQKVTHPEDVGTDLTLLKDVIDGHRQTYQIEKRYIHKKGNPVYVFLTVTGVKDINGKLTHFISQIVDISSRIEAEEKIKGLYDISIKQNESLMNFAHIVSHNLRSHASNLSMLTEFLLQDRIEAAEKENALKMLGKASGGLNETIEHLNEVVQVKTTSEAQLSKLDLIKILTKVIADLEAIVQQSGTRIELQLPERLNIMGVAAYLESIFLNLLTNAIKYRNPKESNLIKITSESEGNCLTLRFADNGLGIDLSKHGSKLFGMYKTFHNNKDAKGIGLFITKNQIESMGGSIRIESQPDQGTTVITQFIKSD